MGWTHYLKRPTVLPSDDFAAASKDCKRLVETLPIQLAGADGTGDPQFTDDVIEFNGVAPELGEPFMAAKVEHHRHGRPHFYSYCKTEHLPYDLAVQASLIILKHHLGDVVKVESDGTDDEWSNARQIVADHLGYGEQFRLDDPD